MVITRNRTGLITEEIQTLLHDRARVQQWLSKLDRVQSHYRPAITDRVRSDYEERRRAVEAKLRARKAELETILADYLRVVEELATERDARSKDLEEAQLRHEVGEYTRPEWEMKRAHYRSVLDALDGQLFDGQKAVEELEGGLSKLTGRTGSVLATQSLSDFYGVEADDDGPAVPRESVAVVTVSVARRHGDDDAFLGELEFLEEPLGGRPPKDR